MSQCRLNFISVLSYTHKEAVGKIFSVSDTSKMLKTSTGIYECKFEKSQSSQSTALLSQLGVKVAQ